MTFPTNYKTTIHKLGLQPFYRVPIMAFSMNEEFAKGLEGLVAAKSSICFVDGLTPKLVYRGYDIKELARFSTFEETCHLLWYGRLPNEQELQSLQHELRSNYEIDGIIIDVLRKLPLSCHPMDALKTSVSVLGVLDPVRDLTFEQNIKKAIKLTAKTSTIIAAMHNIRTGKKLIDPDGTLSIANNFLHMINGRFNNDYNLRQFDMMLVLHADHELNASTFTARVAASTETDLYSAITAAISALKGPLHGGAPMDVMDMINSIKTIEQIDEYIHSALANKRKIPGFGHRVYKVEDPRATILREMAKSLGEKNGNMKYYEFTKKIEEAVQKDKRIYPNVDLYTPACYAILGIPSDLYSCIFAMARVAGWSAHVIEQYMDNRIMRPLSHYQGKIDLSYTPIDQRS